VHAQEACSDDGNDAQTYILGIFGRPGTRMARDYGVPIQTGTPTKFFELASRYTQKAKNREWGVADVYMTERENSRWAS
jgi:hypothetical protein